MPLLASPRTDPSVPNSGTRLLPRVLDGKAHVWPGMKDPGRGEIIVGYLQDPFSRRPVLLTAAPKRAPPQVDDMVAERCECLTVGRHCVVGEVAGDDLLQPFPLLGDRLLHPPLELLLDLLELRPLAIPAGFPVDQEMSPARDAADEDKAQEREGFRLAEAAPFAVAGRKTTELDQPGLLRVERQRELLKPVAHHVEEPTSVGLVQEADHDVICIPQDDHVTGSFTLSPAIGPEIEHIVKVDVGK